jgi:hypothetical protein
MNRVALLGDGIARRFFLSHLLPGLDRTRPRLAGVCLCKSPFLFWSLGIDYRIESGNGVLEFQKEVYLPLGLARLVTPRQRFNGQPAVTNKLVSGFCAVAA